MRKFSLDNQSGFHKLSIIKASDVSSIDYNLDNPHIIDSIVTSVGVNFEEIYITVDTGTYTQEEVYSSDGILYAQEINFQFPKDRPEIRSSIDKYKNLSILALITDNNGYQILIGHKENPLRISNNLDKGRLQGNVNSRGFKITGNTLNESAFLNFEMPTDDGVEGSGTDGSGNGGQTTSLSLSNGLYFDGITKKGKIGGTIVEETYIYVPHTYFFEISNREQSYVPPDGKHKEGFYVNDDGVYLYSSNVHGTSQLRFFDQELEFIQGPGGVIKYSDPEPFGSDPLDAFILGSYIPPVKWVKDYIREYVDIQFDDNNFNDFIPNSLVFAYADGKLFTDGQLTYDHVRHRLAIGNSFPDYGIDLVIDTDHDGIHINRIDSAGTPINAEQVRIFTSFSTGGYIELYDQNENELIRLAGGANNYIGNQIAINQVSSAEQAIDLLGALRIRNKDDYSTGSPVDAFDLISKDYDVDGTASPVLITEDLVEIDIRKIYEFTNRTFTPGSIIIADVDGGLTDSINLTFDSTDNILTINGYDIYSSDGQELVLRGANNAKLEIDVNGSTAGYTKFTSSYPYLVSKDFRINNANLDVRGYIYQAIENTPDLPDNGYYQFAKDRDGVTSSGSPFFLTEDGIEINLVAIHQAVEGNLSEFTPGSVLFADADGTITENANTRFYYDNSINQLKIARGAFIGTNTDGSSTGFVWLGQTSPDSTNYTIQGTGSIVYMNAPTSFDFRIGNSNNARIGSGYIQLARFGSSHIPVSKLSETEGNFIGYISPNLSLAAIADAFVLYAKDYDGAGTASPVFYTEDGVEINIREIYQNTTTFTPGSILFADVDGNITEDTNLFYNQSDQIFSIGYAEVDVIRRSGLQIFYTDSSYGTSRQLEQAALYIQNDYTNNGDHTLIATATGYSPSGSFVVYENANGIFVASHTNSRTIGLGRENSSIVTVVNTGSFQGVNLSKTAYIGDASVTKGRVVVNRNGAYLYVGWENSNHEAGIFINHWSNTKAQMVFQTSLEPNYIDANTIQVWSQDYDGSGDNACFHTKTEDNKIIKLYQLSAIDDANGANNTTVLQAVVDALRNLGFVAAI
ncbi:hypothetical protein [Chondrinema litorale]|uniref:hypothetical protein n=1 Tax=Chondrinema litorale TaxID=2994555 RepID=UPI002542C8A4|nr:hypothetical protein [Chondrinema litorale]UZR95949.1 hypothetical protein OQ292_09000 [Chondrinema litorale]